MPIVSSFVDVVDDMFAILIFIRFQKESRRGDTFALLIDKSTLYWCCWAATQHALPIYHHQPAKDGHSQTKNRLYQFYKLELPAQTQHTFSFSHRFLSLTMAGYNKPPPHLHFGDSLRSGCWFGTKVCQ